EPSDSARASTDGLSNRSRGLRDKQRSMIPLKARLVPCKEEREQSARRLHGSAASSRNGGRPSRASYISTPSANTSARRSPLSPGWHSRARTTPQSARHAPPASRRTDPQGDAPAGRKPSQARSSG